MVKNKEIRAVLMGGIGNQLFQYAYACKVALECGGKVALDKRGLPTRGQQRGSSILDLDIAYTSLKEGNKVANYLWKFLILRSLRTQRSPLSDLLLDVSGNPFPKNRSFSVANYFATSEAIQYYKGSVPLSLSSTPSSRLLLEYDIVSKTDTVVVHHRLGDSVRLKDTRGQLGCHYFRDSLDQIAGLGKRVKKVRVYSDEVVLSRTLLSSWLPDYDLSWAPVDFSAAEVITALARAENLVLSNSTMSWWAAAAGLHQTVVSPSQWDLTGTNHLNLPNWMHSQPDWT